LHGSTIMKMCSQENLSSIEIRTKDFWIRSTMLYPYINFKHLGYINWLILYRVNISAMKNYNHPGPKSIQPQNCHSSTTIFLVSQKKLYEIYQIMVSFLVQETLHWHHLHVPPAADLLPTPQLFSAAISCIGFGLPGYWLHMYI
jgi:hypothetical protein